MGDAPRAGALLKGLPADVILADAADDSGRLCKLAAGKGARAVIPNTMSRAKKYDHDKAHQAERYFVECCFAKVKQLRRVAIRYEKEVRNYAAGVTLADMVLYLR